MSGRKRGRGQPTTCPLMAPPEWGSCPPREVRATQLESKQKNTSDKPRMGQRGWCFHERAGLAASQCQQHRKQRKAENCSRYRTLRRRGSDMRSMTLAWILTREKIATMGALGTGSSCCFVFTFPGFNNCTVAVEENTEAPRWREIRDLRASEQRMKKCATCS